MGEFVKAHPLELKGDPEWVNVGSIERIYTEAHRPLGAVDTGLTRRTMLVLPSGKRAFIEPVEHFIGTEAGSWKPKGG